MKALKAFLVAALIAATAVVVYAQGVTVKNYFAGCSGVACDNVFNLGGTMTYRNRGTVTQITSISTGVTLNTTSGTITTVSQTLAIGAEGIFTVTDSAVGANDVVIATITNPGAGTFMVGVSAVAAGSFTLTITNLDAAAAGNSVLTINFAVIKSAA